MERGSADLVRILLAILLNLVTVNAPSSEATRRIRGRARKGFEKTTWLTKLVVWRGKFNVVRVFNDDVGVVNALCDSNKSTVNPPLRNARSHRARGRAVGLCRS